MTHGEAFLSAIELLQTGCSVELIGERGAGRSHTLGRIREHFVRLGWRTIDVAGAEHLTRSPFAALALAGIFDPVEARGGPLITSFKGLAERVAPDRTVLLVDDADAIDESSWGVIGAVSQRHRVPVLSTRRVPVAPTLHSGTVTGLFTVELPPMGYAELDSALQGVFGSKIDQVTMSRVFAKSGGNVGLAIAILEASRRAGRATITKGVLRAEGSLWHPALQAVTRPLVDALDPLEQAALRTLSLLGPTDVATAARIIDGGTVRTLECRFLVRIVEARGRLIATVNPPILAEHFRHEQLPGLRAAALQQIDRTLADGASVEFPVLASDPPENPAVFVRLVHERLRRRTLRAREAWRQKPGLRAAADLIQALAADLAPSDDEADAVLAASRELTGLVPERADWEIVCATYLARNRHSPDEAVEGLRRAAAAVPGEALRLTAEALVIEMEFAELPARMPFEDLDLDDVDESTRSSVLLAQLVWLTATGRIREAVTLADAHEQRDTGDPRLDTVMTVATLAMGEFTAAFQRSQAKLAEARADFDATRLRVYSFLSAVSAVLLRRFGDAERAIAAPATLGSPASEAPLSFVGLMVLSAYFAANRGTSALVSQFLDELDESQIPDGPFPGLQRDLVSARLAALDGDAATAERISRELGDALWDRGARLAAAIVYLDGLRSSASADAWAHAEARIRSIDSPAVTRWADFADALVRRDLGALVTVVQATAEAGEEAHAAQLAEIALRFVDAAGSSVSEEAVTVLRRMLLAAPRRRSKERSPLSQREREVAELIASGLSNPMIAEALVVSTRTVESHVNKLMRKIGATDRSDIREFIRESPDGP
ncbi:LuxR C-terminal-related transcriptional regulator [Microbacterium sp. NPDC055988]|uniref:helix-turn-helix transcriptional regulator n=1 Tax=Microbacterium sp. NPDC055988 TaxID=3345671 RepID=UPI0035D876DC